MTRPADRMRLRVVSPRGTRRWGALSGPGRLSKASMRLATP